MLQKIPRALGGASRAALGGQPIVAGAMIQADITKPAVSALLVTPTRLLHIIDKKTTFEWPLTEIAVTDYQQPASGQLAALAVLVEPNEILRVVIPRGEAPMDLHDVFRELRTHNNDVASARVAELPWWERKAAWPYAALGRVAGGTTALVQGQHGSLGLGRRGVSIYLGNSKVPSLQLPWQDVTELFVERPDELKERVNADEILLLGVLAWGLMTTEGETFVTVTTKGQALYFAVQAPVTELRGYWRSVLSNFALDPEDAAPAPLTVTLPATPPRAPEETVDLVSQLERLAGLHASGAITSEEYAAAKAAILNGR